jgi:hypothetical protein
MGRNSPAFLVGRYTLYIVSNIGYQLSTMKGGSTMLPSYVRYTIRDARLAKENDGRTVRRTFKTLELAEAHAKSIGVSLSESLCIDVDYPEGSRIRTKRLHDIASAEAFVKTNPMPVPAAKPAKASESKPAEASQAQAPAQEPSPSAAAPAAAQEPEDKPKLALVSSDGGHGFSAPARKPRRVAMAAGVNEATEKKATARNQARASKK